MKPAAGVGSGFCLTTQGGEWCDAQAGRDDCPSCRKRRGLPVLPNVSQDVCGTDPDYLAQAQMSGAKAASLPAAGAAVAGGGGGTGSGSSAATASSNEDKKPAEEEGKRETLSAGVDSAGGYSGGGDSGSSGGSEYQPQSLQNGLGGIGGRGTASSGSDGAMAVASDVQGNAFGPNVFSILGEVLRNRCQSGKLLHCVPSKK